jgi:hypothetical protein
MLFFIQVLILFTVRLLQYNLTINKWFSSIRASIKLEQAFAMGWYIIYVYDNVRMSIEYVDKQMFCFVRVWKWDNRDLKSKSFPIGEGGGR